jgi:hypothetical protein
VKLRRSYLQVVWLLFVITTVPVLLINTSAQTHTPAANPALPSIPKRVFNVLDYGAAGNGVTTNTSAFQSTINAASAAGGGMVEIPTGTYLCGPIRLADKTAVKYPAAPVTDRTPMYRNLVFSNIIATASAGSRAGLIWGLPEIAVSNVFLQNVRITADKPFGVFNAQGVRMVNCEITYPVWAKPDLAHQC